MDEFITGRVHKIDIRKNSLIKSYYESKLDSLTGLLKYEHFIKKLNGYISTNKDPDKGLAIVYSDIRYFKIINEKYGYEVGNELLKDFSSTIKSCSPSNIAFCRVYSDNIVTAVAFNNNMSPEEFCHIISEQNHKLEATLQNKYLDQKLIINTGIFISRDTLGLNAEIVISNANLARKQAKLIEAHDAILFTPDMTNSLVMQMELSSRLPSAIKNGELKVFYQPKVECGSEKVIGAEALIRWIKPDGSFIYPDQFIPLFENNGLIVEVDYFVYRKVFEHIKRQLDDNLPVVPVSMNVSRIHLSSDGIFEYVKNLFEEYKIPPELIEFELTENIYIEDMNSVLPLINKFKNLGIKVSMDDFGSGYSSLNELNNLPIDVLKLDRVFMTDTLNYKQQIVLSSIIEMAKRLNIAVLCEGVENIKQNEFLRKIGCDMVQGYYYSKPLPEKDYIEYIKSRLTETTSYVHFSFDNNLFDDTYTYEGRIIGDGIQFADGSANTIGIHFNGGPCATNILELPPTIYPPSNYTISMWFREDEEQIGASLLYTSFSEGYSSITPHADDLKSSFRIKDTIHYSAACCDAGSALTPRRGVWNYIAVSYNYRTQIASLFLNGLPAGKFENAPILGEPMRILLGGDVYRDSFKGTIADLRIYNQELSPIEILYAFNEFGQ